MSETLFPQPALAEHIYGHEQTSQEAYARELAAHAATIPDFAALPTLFSPMSLPAADRQLLGRYCSDFSSKSLEAGGITPLFRDDIIEPTYCRSVSSLIDKVARESGHQTVNWYAADTGKEPYGYHAQSHQARYASREWEMFFIGYMRQRRMFHTAFMQALITKEPIAANVAAIGDPATPTEVPTTDPFAGRRQPAPAFLYDKTSWLTASLLSTLTQPPEQCSTDMKRHAIEQWAAHADLHNTPASFDIHSLRELRAVRLPWAMCSSSELQTPHHGQWQQNRMIQRYLGQARQPRADGLDALLQERPKDYVQVLVLRIFGQSSLERSSLKDLAKVASLSTDIKDILFAPDAAHNTVFSATPVLPEYGQPASLIDLLALGSVAIAPEAQETIIEGQRLRIRALEDELVEVRETLGGQLVEARQATAALEHRVVELTAAYQALAAQAQRSQATPTQQESSTAPTLAPALMLEFGISPTASTENVVAMVGALRRMYNKELHNDSRSDPETLARLQIINRKLDDILISRGRGKNRE